ncbi:MAG: hypothetical protein ACRDLR_01505, partial [Gaiellaceae bacterium]
LRDASVYWLLAASPLLALDLRRTAGPRWTRWLLAAAGGACGLSFVVYWLRVRGYAQLPFHEVLLPSLYLPAALFAYSTARGLRGGARERGWWFVAAAVGVGIAATGSRTFLIFLLAPLAQLMLPGRRRALSRVVVVVVVAAAVGIGTVHVLGSRAGAAAQRLASATTFVVHPGRDPSWRERSEQSHRAVKVWRTSPLLGVGAGHKFHWTNFEGAARSSFLIDSSLGFVAKFGALGVALLLLLAGAIGAVVRPFLQTEGEVGTGAEALLGFGLVSLGGLLLGVPMEDKGFPLGVLLLLALAQPGRSDPPLAPEQSRRRAIALACATLAACGLAAGISAEAGQPAKAEPVLTEAGPPAKADPVLAGPRDALSRRLIAFEQALWRGDGGTACGLLTASRRSQFDGTCERRLSVLGKGDSSFYGSVLRRRVALPGSRLVLADVRRPTGKVAHYILMSVDGAYRIADLWPLSEPSFESWSAPHLVGRTDRYVSVVARFEHALWVGSGRTACALLTVTRRRLVRGGCETRLSSLAAGRPAFYGSYVAARSRRAEDQVVVAVRRVDGSRASYALSRVRGSWRIDRFDLTWASAAG